MNICMINQAEMDQWRSEARDWFRDSELREVLALFIGLQREGIALRAFFDCMDDDVLDVVARLASLAIADTVERSGPHPEELIENITLAYPTEPALSHYDAETLIVDPRNGDIYVITKRTDEGEVFRAAAPHDTDATTIMEHVATIPYPWITAGDANEDYVVVRCLGGQAVQGAIWPVVPGEPLFHAFSEPGCEIIGEFIEPHPAQGSGIGFTADGSGLVVAIKLRLNGVWVPLRTHRRLP